MKLKQTLLLVAILTCSLLTAQNSYWTKGKIRISKQVLNKKNIKENSYSVYQLDDQAFRNSLNASSKTSVVYFPNQEGVLIKFQVQEKSNMAPALAAKYASIKSYRGFAVSNKSLIISFTMSNNGLSALLTSHSNERAVSIIKLSGKQYISFNSVESKNKIEAFNCSSELSQLKKSTKSLTSKKSDAKTANNNASDLRTLRLAVVAPGEYTELVGGTVEAALAAINNTINAANSIFEEDLGIVLQLIANNDQLIFTDKTTDPYDVEGQGISTTSNYLNITTQEVIDARIPFNDYDLGHLFIARDEDGDTPYGIGNAYGIGNVGTPEKGSAWNYWSQPDVASNPGFIKLFLHEVGHNLGATHTFSFKPDYTFSQVEPFIGRTIMSYGPDHFYYHFYSINQILNHFDLNPWDVSLGSVIAYTDQISLSDLTDTHYIPRGTPFYLEVPEAGADPSYNYNWEQLDYGLTNNMSFWGPQLVSGPLFSSTIPSNNRIRYFPSLQTILDGELTNNLESYISYNQDAEKIGFYETLPSIPRTLSFGLTVRDPNFTKGVYLDSTSVVVVKNSQPFKITSNLAAQNVTAGEIITITWEEGNTNIAPINAEAVDILLSTDGGLTFPITLAKNVPNDGSETVGFPNANSTNARIKIHPINKIFFTINEGVFTISASDMELFFENLTIESTNCDSAQQSFSTAFQYQTANGFAETSALSIAGLPAGLTANLSKNSVSASDTNIDIDFQADPTLSAGTYPVDIIATAASKTVTKQIQVIILNSNNAITTLSTPADTSQNVSLDPLLTWVANTNATKYRVQVSTDVSFATTLIDTYTFNTSYTAINLDANTTYYWRVSGVNTCLENTFSTPFSFTTSQTYEQEFSLISHLKQIEIPNGSSTYFITIEDDVPLLDINVFTSFKGSKIGGLALKLKGPDGTEINLSNGLASDYNTEELNAVADDQADEVPLVSSDIINMSYVPKQALSVFNDKSIKGNWVLTITNATNAQGIYIKDFGLKIKASNNYYVPFAIHETKTVFGTEKRSINLLATNQNNETLSEFTVKITRLPEHGNLINSLDNSIVMLNEVISDHTISYQSTESEDFLGVDYFYFSVNDQTNDSRPAIIVVNNIGAYKNPKALPAYAATPVNNPLELALDIIDFYLSDIATINITTPTNGTASYVNGKVLYTPNEGYIGLDAFSYTADDGRSETTNTINIKVFNDYKTDTKPAFMLEGSVIGYPVSKSIAISGDGNIVAASTGVDPSINSLVFEGHVIVYKRDSQTGIYSQLGNQIFGEKALDQFGEVISLSADGKKLAVATNKVRGYSDGTIDYVKIYQYNETSETWEQIGQTLTFEGGGSLVDLKLDLNADGSILAIGNPRIGFTDYGQGVAEVYQFDQNNNQWNLLGDKFEGELTYGLLGSSISLNAVGDVIAISELLENSRYNKPGYVKIFKYNGISWIQKGKSIRGKETMDRFGKSISINNAGNVIAIGADYELETVQQPGIAGYVSVYIFNQIKNDWELKGQTLDGRLESDYVNLMFGHSVSIDGSGNILSVGAPTFDSDGSNHLETFTLVYQYNKQNNLWSKINLTNNSGKIGSEAYNKAGSSVALSSDGTVLWDGFKPNSDKTQSAVMAYKLISDFEAEIEDVNVAPKVQDGLFKQAVQQVPERLEHLSGSDSEGVELKYLISKAPTNGSLKTQDGQEIVTGEYIPDFASNIFYTSNADATSDSFEYKAFDGEKYGIGFVWIDPISESTLSNHEFELANSIVFYPNPTKDVLNIQGDVSKLKSIEVFSILGKRLLEIKENLNEINISKLQSGMYLLRVHTDEASTTFRIMKE
jgi:hypothetical protein